MFFDPMYLLIIAPGMILATWASFKVKRTFTKFQQVPTRSGLSGAEVAQWMIRQSGVQGVRVEPHQGFLSDHYDPRQKVVRLSPAVYSGRSISAIGVAAHECGHVLQDARGYAPMQIRQALVGPANFGTSASFILMMIGFLFHSTGLVWLGIAAFSAVLLFQIVTLPVEFNASSRARAALVGGGVVTQDEDTLVGKVLNAAAMTYVAAVVTSILTLAYYLMRAGAFSSDD